MPELNPKKRKYLPKPPAARYQSNAYPPPAHKYYRRQKRLKTGALVKGAENRLKNFRQASILAVAITGFFLLIFAPNDVSFAQEEVPDQVSASDSGLVGNQAADTGLAVADTTLLSGKAATNEALTALENLWSSFFYNLPKMLIALACLLLAWVLTWALKKLLVNVIGRWGSSGAIISLVSIAVWLLAIGVALSVVAGDIRALVGSLGLIGLALSWSLQTPIESFTGWLLNSFKGYYRVGDRIRVGEVFGDVYRIDFLTTTVWEIGSPYQPGYVNAEQPTGRLVTFPNNEILTGIVTNLTGDFPYVWDELTVGVANESDLLLSVQVLEKIAQEVLGTYMATPARQYIRLMKRVGLPDQIAEQPQVFVSTADSWTSLSIRYLVGARERRHWKSQLTLSVARELARPEYLHKIIPVYPRQQVQFFDPAGLPIKFNPPAADTAIPVKPDE